MHIQRLRSQRVIERFRMCVVTVLARSRKAGPHLVAIRLIWLVNSDPLSQTSLLSNLIQSIHDDVAF